MDWFVRAYQIILFIRYDTDIEKTVGKIQYLEEGSND